MIKETISHVYESSFKANWSQPAMTNYNTNRTYTFAEFAKEIAKVHLLLEELGVKKGDKVSLISKDCVEWCAVWMGVVTYGGVIVPILPDFKGENIRNIIRHSDSVVVFAGETHKQHLSLEELPNVRAVFGVETLTPIAELTKEEDAKKLDPIRLLEERYPEGFRKEDIRYPEIPNDTLVLINYTSGTTGFSKGVLLTANNLMANISYAMEVDIMGNGNTLLCFLPNAHAYSCTFNFLLPLAEGTHVYILGVPPTPHVLMKAFQDVQPRIILSVPLVLEKIYKGVLLPKLSTGATKWMMKLPLMRSIIYRSVRKALLKKMGGKLEQFIIGGAALNEEVEKFFAKIKFPYTVGYGMTECAPLISYSHPKDYKQTSCGNILLSIEDVRIANAKVINGEEIGEIQVKGENVCSGYYKLPEATEELFTEDNWLRTGDLGMRKGNTLYIKGRIKSMLLSSNGQNIYPEEIEEKINMLPGILESVVIQRHERKLVAVIYPDFAYLEKQGIKSDEEIHQFLQECRVKVNTQLSAYERIQEVEVRRTEFEKTPKQSIKRFLVQ